MKLKHFIIYITLIVIISCNSNKIEKNGLLVSESMIEKNEMDLPILQSETSNEIIIGFSYLINDKSKSVEVLKSLIETINTNHSYFVKVENMSFENGFIVKGKMNFLFTDEIKNFIISGKIVGEYINLIYHSRIGEIDEKIEQHSDLKKLEVSTMRKAYLKTSMILSENELRKKQKNDLTENYKDLVLKEEIHYILAYPLVSIKY